MPAIQTPAIHEDVMTYETLDDSELLQTYAAQGDQAALEQLVERRYPPAYRFFRRSLGDPAAADDATQEAFVALIQGARRFRAGGEFGPWWGAILVNTLRRRHRSRARLRRRETVAATRRPTTTQPQGEQAAEFALVDTQLRALPDELRLPLLLHYVEGLTHRQIGSTLGCPTGTASSRIRRGLEQLRESLHVSGHGALAAGVPALLREGQGPATVPALGRLQTLASQATTRVLLAKACAALLLLVVSLGVARPLLLDPAQVDPQVAGAAPQEALPGPTPEPTGSIPPTPDVAPTGGPAQPAATPSPDVQPTRPAQGGPAPLQPPSLRRSASPATPGRASLQGVVRAGDRAVADAQFDGFFQYRGDTPGLPGGGSLELETDGAGRFSLNGLGAGPYWLQLTHPQLGVAQAHVVLVADRPVEAVFQFFAGLGLLTGRVLLPAGVAPESCRVRLTRADSAWLGDLSPDGSYAFDELAAGPYELSSQVPGFGDQSLHVEVAGEGATAAPDMIVGQGATLRGRVVLPCGQPHAGDQLTLLQLGAPYRGLPSAISEGDGRFEIRGVSPGHYRLEVYVPQPGGSSQRNSLALKVAADDVDLGDLPLHGLEPHPTTLEIRVTDPEGQSVPGAAVYVDASPWSEPHWADESGRVELQVTAGEHLVRAESAGRVSAPQRFEALHAARHELGLQLAPGGALRGTLGAPADLRSQRGRWVRVERIAPRAGPPRMLRGDSGTFEIEALPPGRYRVGFDAAQAEVDVRGGETATVSLDLGELPGRVRVRLEGLPNASASATWIQGEGFRRQRLKDGQVELLHLGVGPARVELSLGEVTLMSPIDVPGDGEAVEVVFRWPERPATIRGRALYDHGDSMMRSRSVILHAEGIRVRAPVFEGAFEVERLPAGRYQAWLALSGAGPEPSREGAWLEVRAGEVFEVSTLPRWE